MEKKLLSFLAVVFTVMSAHAQTYSVKGSVQDTSGVTLPGASIKLFVGKDSVAASSDLNGGFNFNNVKAAEFTLQVAFIGFQKFVKQYSIDKTNRQAVLEPIRLKEAANNLGEITVTGVVPVRVKEDTVEYSAAAYKVREGDAAEEMLKKLPGVTVDKDGNVTIQGKPLTQIRINGKDFFGGDVASAIQNLPADIIKNMQFIDDYGDQAKLTGIKSGEPNKVLNINIQEDKKKGYTMRGTGGLGNESRYIATLRGNTFKGEQQISLESSMNNTNTRGGGGDGITNTKALALNYRDEWGKKVSSYGGVNYNGRNNSTESRTLRQNIYDTFTRFDDQKSFNDSKNSSAQLFWNFEYRLDSLNFIKLSPSYSQNSSDFGNNGTTFTTVKKSTSLRDNTSFNGTSNQNYGANLLLNHKFRKQGRNFSIYTNFNHSNGDNDRDSKNIYLNTDSNGVQKQEFQNQITLNGNSNTSTGMNVSYTEPLLKATFLELSYNWNRNDTRSERNLTDVNPVTGVQTVNQQLSNDYRYQFITNRFGLNFRDIHQKFNYTIGLGVQPALLKGDNLSQNVSTSKTTLNWIPTARFVYQIAKQKSLTMNYSGRSNQPSFFQLQPITDNSNLRNTVQGNPDLKPEFSHGVNVDYNSSDYKTGNIVLLGASASQVNNKIVTNRVVDGFNQFTTYQNTNGFYSLRSNYSVEKAIHERRYRFTLYGSTNFTNNVSYAKMERNIGKNLILEQGFKFRLDIKDVVDAELNTSYSVNRTTYTVSSFQTRRTNRFNLGLNGRNYFFKDLTLGYDLSKTINSGYTYSNNANPMILNAYLEYRFMKGRRGALRLQGFDLLDQNNGIRRDVFDNQIVDIQTNRLARYFLMSFNLRVNKFGGGVKRPG